MKYGTPMVYMCFCLEKTDIEPIFTIVNDNGNGESRFEFFNSSKPTVISKKRKYTIL